ncbi:hypothetical protein [Streptomyces subrutilus]|uniref:hypothetical protein n=1 Tax=Streptomyces subrutilus TaxID=36818 RepID=UPI0033E2E0EE
MPAYGFAHLRARRHHPDILEYLERVQGTLDPFHGRFIVHGPPAYNPRRRAATLRAEEGPTDHTDLNLAP